MADGGVSMCVILSRSQTGFRVRSLQSRQLALPLLLPPLPDDVDVAPEPPDGL